MDAYYQLNATGRFAMGSAPGEHFPGDGVDVLIELSESGDLRLYFDCLAALIAVHLDKRSPVTFEGVLVDGRPISIRKINRYIGPGPRGECVGGERCTVGDRERAFDSVSVALTNLRLDADQMNLTLEGTECVFERLAGRSVDQYSPSPIVTSELRVRNWSAGVEQFDRFLDRLCLALSVVQGTRIEWTRQRAALRGSEVWEYFGGTITKNFTSGTMCVDPFTTKGKTIALRAVCQCFPRLVWFSENHDRESRIVKAWLDARQQADFLELRTLKHVVVLEALCTLVDEPVSGVISRDTWRLARERVLPEVGEFLRSAGVDQASIDEVLGPNSWGNLNRRSFRSRLVSCLGQLKADPVGGQDRIKTFVAIRNRMVHDLKFARRDELKPPMEDNQQYFFVASFVDEVILRLFGLRDAAQLPLAE